MKEKRAVSGTAALETHRATILLAEDNEVLRALLAQILRKDGFEVIEARNGLEVLDHVASSLSHPATSRGPDLLITDIHMPGLGGLDAMASLSQAGRLPRTIVMTGGGSDEERDRALGLGALAILDKPFGPEALRRAVSERLQKVA